jgi:hypothetical protein
MKNFKKVNFFQIFNKFSIKVSFVWPEDDYGIENEIFATQGQVLCIEATFQNQRLLQAINRVFQLNFSVHIDHIVRKIFPMIAVFRRINFLFTAGDPSECLFCIYSLSFQLFVLYLGYCNGLKNEFGSKATE